MPANILLTPRKFANKNIALKIDTTHNTDPVPTGALNWFEARNVEFTSMDAETQDRNIDLGFFGDAGAIIVAQWASIAFDVALVGSGTAGTAPKWAPAMLSCGTAETIVAVTSAAYNLASTALKSCTIYIEIDGTLYKLISCRGNAKATINAKGLPMVRFEFMAAFVIPAAGSISGISKTGWPIEDAVNAVNTGFVSINAVNLAFSKLEYDLGNDLRKINLPGPQLTVDIADRKPTASVTVLAPALGVFDPYTLASGGTTVALTNTHGLVAGKKIKSDLNVQIIGCKEIEIEGMLAYDLSLKCNPVAAAGNDQIAITNI